jgi:ketosteroid isomerase-like protein
MGADEQACLRFNDAITAQSVEALALLMSDDHRFVDSAGATVEGKAACLDAWRGFFDAFPDYRNELEDVASQGDAVVLRGRSICSDPRLDGPALWSARMEHGLLTEWRVHLDVPENRRALGVSPAG